MSRPLVYSTIPVKQDPISLTTQQYSNNFLLCLNHCCMPLSNNKESREYLASKRFYVPDYGILFII